MRAAGLLNCKNEDGESKRFPKVPASRRGCEAGTSRGSPKITPELQAERVLICKPSRNSRRYREAYRNAWQRASLYAAIGGTIKASSYWGRGFFVIMATVQSQAQLCAESWIPHRFASGEHAAAPEMAAFAISGARLRTVTL